MALSDLFKNIYGQASNFFNDYVLDFDFSDPSQTGLLEDALKIFATTDPKTGTTSYNTQAIGAGLGSGTGAAAEEAVEALAGTSKQSAKEISKDEMDFQRELQIEKLAAQERIANIKTTDTTERIQAIADTKYDGDTIKASREVNFADEVYPNLVTEYGQQTVATSVIDTSGLQKQKDIDRFVKQNPQLARQVVYDVRTGKAVRFGLVNGKYTIQPADPSDKDDTGFAMPDPDKPTPGLFGQETKPGKTLKEILPDFRDPGFDESFYQ